MRYAGAIRPAERRPAPMQVKLRASAWADTWDGKPTAPTLVGVRLVAEMDLARARSVAESAADALHPRGRGERWVEAYNQALMHYVLGHALCLHDDVATPLFEMQECVISQRLTTEGTLRLWDAVEELRIVDSPLSPEISEDDLAVLVAELRSDTWWARMAPSQRKRAARLLQRVAEMGAG